MSFFNVKLIADGHFPRISLSFLSQLLFLFMSISSPLLNPSGYKSSLSIGSSASMPRSANLVQLYLHFIYISLSASLLFFSPFCTSPSSSSLHPCSGYIFIFVGQFFLLYPVFHLSYKLRNKLEDINILRNL